MVTNNRDKILLFAKTHSKFKPSQLVTFLGIGSTAIHRQLNKLVANQKLIRVGRTPSVYYKMPEGQRIIELLSDQKATFEAIGVRRVGLFGSFVRGEQNEHSDIDLLIDFQPGQKTYRNLLNVTEEAEKLLGRTIDVVTPEAISPHILPYVEKDVTYVQTT